MRGQWKSIASRPRSAVDWATRRWGCSGPHCSTKRLSCALRDGSTARSRPVESHSGSTNRRMVPTAWELPPITTPSRRCIDSPGTTPPPTRRPSERCRSATSITSGIIPRPPRRTTTSECYARRRHWRSLPSGTGPRPCAGFGRTGRACWSGGHGTGWERSGTAGAIGLARKPPSARRCRFVKLRMVRCLSITARSAIWRGSCEIGASDRQQPTTWPGPLPWPNNPGGRSSG